MFGGAGVLLEADWSDSLENMGNENKNLWCKRVRQCRKIEKKGEKKLSSV